MLYVMLVEKVSISRSAGVPVRRRIYTQLANAINQSAMRKPHSRVSKTNTLYTTHTTRAPISYILACIYTVCLERNLSGKHSRSSRANRENNNKTRRRETTTAGPNTRAKRKILCKILPRVLPSYNSRNRRVCGNVTRREFSRFSCVLIE